jgi:PAS domain S-box-containing protein
MRPGAPLDYSIMAEGKPGARILLVEDDAIIALAERRVLAGAGYEVEIAGEGAQGVGRALSSPFDLVLMDIDLGAGIDGGEASRRIRAGGGPPVVFLSSHSEESAVAKTKDAGGYGFIVKGSGDRVLLASVRMAIELASALRGLEESEERWASLAETAPDFILSIGPDRIVRSINRAPEGRKPEDYVGMDIAAWVLPEDGPAFARKLEAVFREGRVMRHIARAYDRTGSLRSYEAYIGPVFEGARAASATAVLRDVTVEGRLATGEPLRPEDKESLLRTAMASFDFAPVRELFRSFRELTGVLVSIVSTEDVIYATTGNTRVCETFHWKAKDSFAACVESNARGKALLDEGGGKGFVDYRCANGLRDIAKPLAIEGVHWATLFLGQFLYEDDELDEAACRERARQNGWGEDDYLAALREVPRYPRERIAGLMAFFDSLGSIVTSMAYGAYEGQLLARHAAEARAAAGEMDRRYRLLAENVGDVIWTLDPRAFAFTYVSPSITALRGLTVEEALAERVEESMTGESLARVRASMAELAERLAKGDPTAALARTGLYEQPCKDGSLKWIEVTTKPVFDASGALVEITGVSRDATARVLADSALKKALADKDRLYAELQHRVKNSLALIVSLLSLEAGSIEDEGARAPLEEAQARVRSVGLLYEQLYRTRSVEDIDLGAYLHELVRSVLDSPLGAQGIRLESDCASIRIATDRAVSAGLLLYEMAANAVKHAFPGGRGGRLRLALGLEGDTVRLCLEDDGVGLPAGFDLGSGKGLGSLLIAQLAVQLGGRAEAGPGIGGAGAGFRVLFPLAERSYSG